MKADSQSIFLLGAGFNADAGPEICAEDGQWCYPLVGDLLRICFELDVPPAGQSIEDLFQAAQEDRNSQPVERLVDCLMKADHRLGSSLRDERDLRCRNSCYWRFFKRFGRSHFLTFNYDSLPEMFLLQQKSWYPQDGFGVPVKARVLPLGDNSTRSSDSLS